MDVYIPVLVKDEVCCPFRMGVATRGWLAGHCRQFPARLFDLHVISGHVSHLSILGPTIPLPGNSGGFTGGLIIGFPPGGLVRNLTMFATHF